MLHQDTSQQSCCVAGADNNLHHGQPQKLSFIDHDVRSEGEEDNDGRLKPDEDETLPCSSCDLLLCSEELLECPCGNAVYCSSACQAKDWGDHKTRCSAAKRQVSVQICSNCRRTSTTLHICRCGTTYYCSQNCQKKHWNRHAHMCASRKHATTASYVRPTSEKATQTDKWKKSSGDKVQTCQSDENESDKSFVTGFLSQGSPKSVLVGENANPCNDAPTTTSPIAGELPRAAFATGAETLPSVGDDAEADDFVIRLTDAPETGHKSRIFDGAAMSSSLTAANSSRKLRRHSSTAIKYNAKNPLRDLSSSSPPQSPVRTMTDGNEVSAPRNLLALPGIVVTTADEGDENATTGGALGRFQSARISMEQIASMNTIAIAVHTDFRDPWVVTPVGGKVDSNNTEARARKVARKSVLVIQR